MGKLISAMVIIFIGIFMLPALLCMALGLGATIVAFILNPKVILTIVVVLGMLWLPGIIIGWIAKK